MYTHVEVLGSDTDDDDQQDHDGEPDEEPQVDDKQPDDEGIVLLPTGADPNMDVDEQPVDTGEVPTGADWNMDEDEQPVGTGEAFPANSTALDRLIEE